MRPSSIVRFDQLFLLSLVLGLVNFALDYETRLAELQADPASAELGLASAGFMFGVLGFSMAIALLLWFLVSRKANNVARWIMAVLAALGLITTPFSLGGLSLPAMIVTISVTLVQVASIWFLFRPDAEAWFRHGGKGMDPDVFE
jgi:asparagine N-glycosylation enzyme membrane subunit Stt3